MKKRNFKLGNKGHSYLVRLEKTELARKGALARKESSMSGSAYQQHIRAAYGHGIWADRLIKELTGVHARLGASAETPPQSRYEEHNAYTVWENEGGALP